ncbi:MAG: cupin domain-containing protein [Vicinamibacterales bacterium]
MRKLLLFVVLCTAAFHVGAAQTPTQTPAPRRAATTASMRIHVTSGTGLLLGGVRVTAQGPTARDGVTGDDGALRFVNLTPGNYRLRFAHEKFITLERDVSARTAETAVDVTLSAAPEPPPKPEPEPAPPPPAPKPLPPVGDPKTVAIPAFLDSNFVGRAARKDSELGCTPSGSAVLHQLREPWASHTHDTTDEWLYVVAGEGILLVDAAEQKIQPGSFSLIPRAHRHAVHPQGRNPLILVSVLSGAPCESPAPTTDSAPR